MLSTISAINIGTSPDWNESECTGNLMQIYLLNAKGMRRRTISAGVECAVRATGDVSDGIRKGMQMESVRGAIGDGG
jgi:hypothetical protein